MSKYTRSLPLPIVSLLNKNRELIYNENFSGMAIVGHALCVSKAKRTALACAHSEAQSSKRKAIGFYKDPVLSAEDITYGLLAYYNFKDDDNSLTAIEYLMDAFANLIDVVPALVDESANEQANVSEPVSASVNEVVSASVNEREREHDAQDAEATSETTSEGRKTKAKAKTKTRKKKAKKAQMDAEELAQARLIARTHVSKSVQRNPKISIPLINKEAHDAYAYLRSITRVDARSNLIVECIDDDLMKNEETQQRGLTSDSTAENSKQIVVNQRALKAFPPLTTDERATLIRVIYDKYVKGTNK